MGTNRDDELARTATAPVGGAGSQPELAPADPVGPNLGRYKLERELGAGGMGVVHAAFDPDLERRVALKVLRTEAGTSEARKRLLDEARAMARLQHPNVVTVHEVASANGRDFVAMEMIDGETLADWMRKDRRPEAELIDAFIAAGRGLAAAHAEGIVHRDFKPHNVLRSRKGRIAVTDFGLARETENFVADPLAETRELKLKPGTAVSTSTPSSPLGGNTVTGTVLGTPAYMAPEQWSGGAVTPASDQFAFCVALWEALSGERPFKGPTVETLREEVSRGPAQLDTSKIPRRLRAPLLRGLDPDPKRRWPSMDALLAAMASGEKKSKAGYIVAGSAVCASAAVLVAIKLAGGGAATPEAPQCRAPVRTIEQVWPEGTGAKLRAAGQGAAVELLESDARAWRNAHDMACATDPAKREPQLACLDGVLARFDAVVQAMQGVGKTDLDVGQWLVDASVCTRESPPRLVVTATPQLRATIAGLFAEAATRGKPTKARADALIEKSNGDPCASVYGRYLAIVTVAPAERERLVAEATEQAERCGDDRVRADIALLAAELALENSMLGAAITSKIKFAEVATQRVAQADILGTLDRLRSETAGRANQLDEAITRMESAMKQYAARGRVAAELGAGLRIVELKQARTAIEDLASIQPTLDALRARGIEKLGADDDTVREIERAIAGWKFDNNDAPAAVALLAKLYKPTPNDPARKITGKVVDQHGAPVEGATVGAGKRVGGNGDTAIVLNSDSIRVTTTKADGTFEIPDAVDFGAIVAQKGDLRSVPVLIADTVTLTLEPTSTLSGRADLHGKAPQSVKIVAVDPDAPDMRYGWASSVSKDGSFEIAGVPRKKVKVFAVVNGLHTTTGGAVGADARTPAVKGLALEVPSGGNRVVHVVVRSTLNVSVGNAAVLVLPGKQGSMTARQLRVRLMGSNEQLARQIEGEKAPAPVVKLAHSGDMFATMSDVPDGVASACALALPADLADPQLGKKIDANLDKLKIECVPIPDGAEAVVIEIPPFPRID